MTIVFVSGRFNILHPGHLRLLRFAKECGDRLIVGVESDKLASTSAHIDEKYRLEGLQTNSWVDEAFIMNEPVTDIISNLKPDIVVKGKEHESKFNSELSILDNYGGQLLFSSGETIFSSLDLIHKEFRESDSRTIVYPQEYLERHNINPERLIKLLDEIQSLKICVIGDLIVDEYVTCQPLGMSQEDPTIVVTPIDTTRFIGGAGIVAAHAAGLGASVDFISITGCDNAGEFAHSELSKYGVNANLLVDESRPTTLKQRYRSQGKSLLRVSHLHQGAISSKLQKKILALIIDSISEIDLLVFSDFNYGCLPQQLVDEIINITESNNVYMAADSQSSSQIGDISRFKRMDLLTPTEREARISTRNHEDGLVILAELLRKQSTSKNILLKLGGEGLLIHADNGKEDDWLTDRIGALNSSPKDVAGAGDSLLIASALIRASGGNIWEAAYIGSLVAALQVSRVGNTPLKIKEILLELEF